MSGSSTINPTIPLQGSPIASAPVRANFLAAQNDVNNLYSLLSNPIPLAQISGLGALATQSSVNLASQALSGSYTVALHAAGNTSLSLPASGTLATTSQLTAGNISGLAASATTDATNAANIASGTLPAERLPNPSASALGGVQSATASSNQFMTGISTSGVPQFAQPSVSNVSGLGALATQSSVNLASQAVSGSYTVALNATANSSLNIPKEGQVLSSVSGKNYAIRHDGSGDFTDIGAALGYLAYVLPLGGANLNLDAGTHNYSNAIYVGQNWFKYVWINGATPVYTTVTSVASSSGSAGAWSLVLNVGSTAGISVGQYAVITEANTAAGTNPTYVEGVWPITAVGSGTITVSTTHRYSAPPSGAVTATLTVPQTILHFTGCDGFDIWDDASAINITNVVIVGDGTAGKYGISLQDICRLNIGGILAVYGFGGYNFFAGAQSAVAGNTLVCSNSSQTGIVCTAGASIDIAGQIVSSGNGSAGILADGGAYVRAQGSLTGITSSGNAGDGFNITSGAVVDPYSWGWATGNGGYGWHAGSGGRIVQNFGWDGHNASGGSAAPLPINYGTLLTTPVAGSLEWDGSALYCTPASSIRGIIPVYQYSKVTASGGVSLANSASAQSFLPSGAQNFPVRPYGVIYRFRARLLLNMNTGAACTKSFLFSTGGGAAFSWIAYTVLNEPTNTSSGGGYPIMDFFSVPTASTFSGNGNVAYVYTLFEGEFVMSAGGTIQPQIQFSAQPGGTCTNMQGSYFELYTYGANAASAGLS